jgi:hypothetical protein
MIRKDLRLTTMKTQNMQRAWMIPTMDSTYSYAPTRLSRLAMMDTITEANVTMSVTAGRKQRTPGGFKTINDDMREPGHTEIRIRANDDIAAEITQKDERIRKGKGRYKDACLRTRQRAVYTRARLWQLVFIVVYTSLVITTGTGDVEVFSCARVSCAVCLPIRPHRENNLHRIRFQLT